MKFEKQLLLSLFIFISFISFGQSPESSCLTLNDINIYPNESDWGAEGLGRVLISSTDGTFHTSYQTQDRKLKIRVELPSIWGGHKVYFLLEDPDDPSPLDPDSNGGDNLDGSGTLNLPFDTAIQGGSIAIAENTLTITNRYSGDNYKVLVSLTEPVHNRFPDGSVVQESMVFTAWKRIYTEYAKMYKKGSYLISETTVEIPGYGFRGFEVGHIDDFQPGLVRIENNNDYFQFTSIGKIVVLGRHYIIPQTNNFQNNSTFIFEKYSIVRHPEDTETYEMDPSQEVNPFPDICLSGTFVEILPLSGTVIVPKVKLNSGDDLDALSKACLHHSTRTFLGNNYIQMVAAGPSFGPTGFNSVGLVNFIGYQGFVFDNAPNKADTYYHEFAHMFGLKMNDNDHIDKSIDNLATCGSLTDGCLLSYKRNLSDNLVIIDKEVNSITGCSYLIRSAMDKR